MELNHNDKFSNIPSWFTEPLKLPVEYLQYVSPALLSSP